MKHYSTKRVASVFLTIIYLIGVAYSAVSCKSNSTSSSLEITDISSTVSPGDYAYVSIHGKPNTDYSITVTYKSGPSTAEGLYTKTSDSNGNVSWEWKVGTKTSSGTYPIRISGGGQSISENFTVL